MADGIYGAGVTIQRDKANETLEQRFDAQHCFPTEAEACQEARRFGWALVNGDVAGLEI